MSMVMSAVWRIRSTAVTTDALDIGAVILLTGALAL